MKHLKWILSAVLVLTTLMPVWGNNKKSDKEAKKN